MATQTTDIESDIRKADDNFEQTFGRGDAAGMAELYTKDGMLLPTGSDFVQGKKDIADFWQGAMDMGIYALALPAAITPGRASAPSPNSSSARACRDTA